MHPLLRCYPPGRTPFALLSASLLVACAHTAPIAEEAAAPSVDHDEALEHGGVLEYRDVNEDGRVDLWRWLEPAPVRFGESERLWVTQQRLDLNFDGLADVERRYENGTLVEERSDRDFDGTWETRTIFADDRPAIQYVDRDGDGSFDAERRYVNGALTRVELDTSRDGEADQWRYYREGTLQRTGDDMDGDGAADHWVVRYQHPGAATPLGVK